MPHLFAVKWMTEAEARETAIGESYRQSIRFRYGTVEVLKGEGGFITLCGSNRNLGRNLPREIEWDERKLQVVAIYAGGVLVAEAAKDPVSSPHTSKAKRYAVIEVIVDFDENLPIETMFDGWMKMLDKAVTEDGARALSSEMIGVHTTMPDHTEINS